MIVVKLDNPQAEYYSASTAAPLTKTILQAALAARDAALNRRQLMNDVVTRASATDGPRARLALDRPESDSTAAVVRAEAAAARAAAAADLAAEPPPVTFTLPASPTPDQAAPTLPPRAVPAVAGMPLRDAVRTLHDAGFRVRLVRGTPVATVPAAGAMAGAGSTVVLRYDF